MRWTKTLSTITGRRRPRSRAALLGIAAFVLGCSPQLQAQITNYTFNRSVQTYTEITGGLVLGTETTNYDKAYVDNTGTPAATAYNYYWIGRGAGIDVGFGFPYNGDVFDRIGVSSNGWVSLGKSSNGATAVYVYSGYQDPITQENSNNQWGAALTPDRMNRIAAMAFSGLRAAGSGTGAELRVQTIGSSPNRTCVIQWKNYSAGGSERFNFQIHLKENGAAEVQYKDPATGWVGTSEGQVGIRGAAATHAVTDWYTLYTPPPVDGSVYYDWSLLTRATQTYQHCGLGASYTTSLPADGTTLRWAPPTCLAPTNVAAAFPKSNSLDITWTNSAGTGTYEYAVNTVNSPTTGTPVTGTSAGSSATASGLTSNTAYYVFVRKDCGGGDFSTWSSPTGTVTTAPACGETLTVATSFTGTPYGQNWTVCGAPGQVATATFSAFNFSGGYPAALYIYNGPTTASTQISSGAAAGTGVAANPGGFSGTALPGPFTSSDVSGCLTLRFVSTYGGENFTTAISCAAAPTCYPPGSVHITPAPQGGTVTWAGTSTSYQYKIVSNGALSSAPAIVSGFVSGSPFTITDNALIGGTPYTLYARGICTPGDTSSWSFATNFKTAAGCGGPFNGYRSSFTSYPINMDSVTTICPNSVGDVVTVAFTHFAFGQAGDDAMYVFDGPTTSSSLLASANGATSSGFPAGGFYGSYATAATAGIPGPFTSTHSSGCLTFRFRTNATQGSSYDDGWESNVTCAPAPACSTPGAVTVSAITGTSASISWTGGGSNYIIEYGPAGFTPGTGATAGSGSSTVISNATSPWSLSGLSPVTAYKIVVRQVCAGPSYGSNSYPANFGTSMDCSTAQVLSCGGSATATWVSGTSGAATYQGAAYSSATCLSAINGASGQEFLYRISAPSAGTYQLNIAANSLASYNQSAYMIAPVSSGCGAAAFTCIGLSALDANYPYAGVPSAMTMTLAAGDYYVLADAYLYSSGAQTFQVNCPGLPPCVTAPTFPLNGTTLANTTTPIAFSWPAAFGATGYDVYFQNALVASVATNSITSSSYTAAAIAATYGTGTAVTWRVVPKNSYGTSTCTTNFTFRVGGNGNGNAIALTPGVPVSGSTRTANGFTNQQTVYFGNDATYSFTASACASGVNVQMCLTNYVSQNYTIFYVKRASDGTTVGSDSPGYLTPPDCRTLNVTGITPGQSYYIVVDGYSGQLDFTLSYTEVQNTTDTDGDGVADCSDNCPVLAGVIGGACTADAGYENGVITEDCECVGTLIPLDCLGVGHGTALPGTSCDDGNAATGNDVYGNDCVCAGQTIDCLGVAGGTALPGTSCDDGNALTAGDTWSAGCVCSGTCSGNQVVVNIHTDANGGQTTWQIQDAFASTVASGGPYTGQDNVLVSETRCLPTNLGNCYSFFVFDSFGDGMSSGNGYWELTTTGGGVVLRDSFVTGSQSPSATPSNPAYGTTGHSFCLPLGPATIATTNCGIYTNTRQAKVYCAAVSGVSMYQFEFSDPDAGFLRRISVPRNWVKFSEMVTNPLAGGTTYFVRTRVDQGATGFSDDHYGAGCEMGITGISSNCTYLITDSDLPTFSCGVTKRFGGSDKIWAQPVLGATQYRFRFTAGSFTRVILSSSYQLLLSWTTNPLVNGVTYDVQVESMVGTVWSGFCGPTCQVTIGTPQASRPEARVVTLNAADDLRMWPNPVGDGRVNLVATGLTEAEQNITVDIFDIRGVKVFAEAYGNSGDTFNTVMELPSNIASGVYVVNITINGRTSVQRLSVQ